ncbi:PilN domain-containing protein [Oleiagrimonas sp. MCCC 1A03011]|uniref:PilN domain-containing protein n=1 Tax=Oleiagrimonas sp. MCCC 1A03011 TaxID=1926883 RepID=UPI001F0BCCE6|nr:PilN domain-containing protein [Oleiagrimonas sp. MCCC 1A03011]
MRADDDPGGMMASLAQSMRPQLEQVRRAWRGSPLPGFLRWWGAELRACLPARWRASLSGGAQWRILLPDGARWQVRAPGDEAVLVQIDASLSPAQQQAALREACAGIDPQDLHLALCLPAQAVLRRHLKLPTAATANLRQVVAYEMDRQTPFTADQVYFDPFEQASGGSSGPLEVELVAAPRQRLEPMLTQLREAGIELDAVDALDGDRRLGANLLPPDQRRRRVHPRKRLNLALGALFVLLVVLAMGQWLHNRRAVIDAMQAHVDAMHDQARSVMKLRQRLVASAGAAGFLARQRSQSPTVLAVLDDVSKRLPTDTWLERFNIGNDGSVGMQGQSPQAARLVDLLKKSPYLSEPGFQGVIQTDPRTHKERFFLTAHLKTDDAGKPNDKGGDDAAQTR